MGHDQLQQQREPVSVYVCVSNTGNRVAYMCASAAPGTGLRILLIHAVLEKCVPRQQRTFGMIGGHVLHVALVIGRPDDLANNGGHLTPP